MGNIRTAMLAATVGGTIILGLGGCSVLNRGAEERPSSPAVTLVPSTPATTPSAVPSATGPAQSEAAAAAAIDKSYSALFEGVYRMSHATADKVEDLNASFAGGDAAAYVRQMNALLPALSHVNKRGVDDSQLASFYYGLTAASIPVIKADTTGVFKDLRYSVDESKVVVSDDGLEAKVPASAIRGTYKGQTVGSTSTATTYAVYVDGKWYIDPTRADQ